MAAQALAQAGVSVDVYDRMPSVGRKFLLAGRGGLNLTHAEPSDRFVARYGHEQARDHLASMLDQFGATQVREWAHQLGIETFVGSSSRVFPVDMKAAPLLRAWLHQLRGLGVKFHMRHHWLGWSPEGDFQLRRPDGSLHVLPRATTQHAHAVVLALGGASWARLGSDGAWMPWLQQRQVPTTQLMPSNCGFDVITPKEAARSVGWSAYLRERFAGQPIKPVVASFTDAQGHTTTQQGEFVLTDTGVEGSLIYAFSSQLRNALVATGQATLWLDLLPDHTAERVLKEVSHPRGSRSLPSHLKSRLGLSGLKVALLHEVMSPGEMNQPEALAAAIKALPLHLAQARPMDEAISTAGGVSFDGLTEGLMLQASPGVFCAGEMLDWEAPTGGYLLTACLSTGWQAGQQAAQWLQAQETSVSS
jgi:uncharacterized flavoprotein (TIGR03862 family)